MKNKKMIWTVVIAVVVAVGAFFGGVAYGKHTAAAGVAGRFGAFSSSTRAFAGRGGTGAGAGAAGGFVTGQISSLGTDSFTVQLANGNSQVVFYSTSTSVIIPTPASASDLKTGTNVMIVGTSNSDGSLTAQSVQVRQAGQGGFGPGSGNGNATSSGQ